MKKAVNRIGKTLKNIIGGVLIASLLAPGKIDAQSQSNEPTSLTTIGNPYSRPNLHLQLGRNSLDYYGSGDVNNDEKIDFSDVDAMNSLSNDRSDVDGDGIPSTQIDKQILLDYLNGKISYLPGDWNKLKTREERVSWIEKMIKIDDLDKKVINLRQNEGWICWDVSTQLQINFYGISNPKEFLQMQKTSGGGNFSIENVARFNLPTYQISTSLEDGKGSPHSINTILVGEDIRNFENEYNFSNVAGKDELDIKQGNIQMSKNSPVSVGLMAYIKRPIFKDNIFSYIDGIIKWDLTNGIASEGKTDYTFLTLHNPNFAKLKLGNLENLLIDSGKYPKGTKFTIDFLKNQGYIVTPDTTKEGTDQPIVLEQEVLPDTTWISGNHYKFKIKSKGTIYFGRPLTDEEKAWGLSAAVTKSDSTIQEVEVNQITATNEENNLPTNYELYQNYPNPFNPSTTIKYNLPNYTSNFKVEIYDISGRLVRTLKGDRSAGEHEINWNGKNEFNKDSGSGVYIYRLFSDNFSISKKMVLTK